VSDVAPRGGNESGPAVDSKFESLARAVALTVGGGLLLAGVVAAFMAVDGTSTAALLTVGFALVCVSYVGRYITRIRFREFELLLERISAKAEQALSSLDSLTLGAKADTGALTPGGSRDMARDKKVAAFMEEYRSNPDLTLDDVRKIAFSDDPDARIVALGVMKVRPDLWDAELVMTAIEHPRGNYDQDRFLVVAADMLHTFTPPQRDRLRVLVEHLRESGEIGPTTIRWDTSRRLLRLIGRVERDSLRT